MENTRNNSRTYTPSVDPTGLRLLLQQLVDIYSPTGKEEDILEFVHGYLTRRGLPVVRQAVDDHRYNLLVLPPDTDAPVVFVGHLDTVAAYDLEDYEYREEDQVVYGLGTADMKSGCAALIEEYLSVWETGAARIPAALALVVGEEEDGDGAEALIKEYHFPWAIIAEPTDLEVCLSHYGYVELQLVTKGKRMHASLANRDQNPIEAMLRLLLEFSTYAGETRAGLIYNIRDLYSPPAGFVVPDQCEVWIDLHLPPDAPIGEITMELEEIVQGYRERVRQLDITLRFTTIQAGYEIPEKGPLVKILKDLYRDNAYPWISQAFRSHSDASTLWEAGIKPIILGPGQLTSAHAPDESVVFEDVVKAANLYAALMAALGT
jgi:acetylornithine deacetylase